MLINLNKSLMNSIFNSYEFKEFLLSRRWFSDKSFLSNSGLDFDVSLEYFEIITESILLTVFNIKTKDYLKNYFLPLIYYKELQDILEPSEINKDNMLKLTENTFSKQIEELIDKKQQKTTLNLLEAEQCIFFWKRILFDKSVIERFNTLSMELTLYEYQSEDKINAEKVQNLIAARLDPDQYDFSIQQLGGGNTTNSLYMLNLVDNRILEPKNISYILKSYKEYVENLEPSTLYLLVRNKFLNAPKIYGTIKIHNIETIGIIENIQNVGNIGDIFWNELNNMVNSIFKDWNADYSYLSESKSILNLIEPYLVETLKISEEIGLHIIELHEALVLQEDKNYSIEIIESQVYLKKYSEKLDSIISNIQSNINQKSENKLSNFPEINSVLIDIRNIVKKFRSKFSEGNIKIQPVHQDLHMQQILYNKINEHYQYFFVDFEGDPQLKLEEKKGKFPIEKDISSFLRSLSYIKFHTFLNFIEKTIKTREQHPILGEILYNIVFRKKTMDKSNSFDILLNVLNVWEDLLIDKLLNSLKLNKILINYFTIERALYELNYEILFRPNQIIIPVLGLKEITEKN